MSQERDPAFEEWVAEARAVSCAEVVERRGIALSRGVERVGPCPVCGGTDRFAVNTRKDIWHCRGAGKGGKSILLVQYLDGADFLAACETLTGRPAPHGGAGTRLSARELEARERARQAQADARDATAEQYRERERRALFHLFQGATRIEESPTLRDYFRVRDLLAPPRCRVLRFFADAPYFHGREADGRGRSRPREIFRGPAMLAAITDDAGVFRGLHVTWIDLARPKGKAEIFDPETGELLPSKKVRGSKQGNRITLVPAPSGVARRAMAGEGIETTLSVWSDLVEQGWELAATEFAAGIDLGNLVGGADGTVPHPTDTVTDARGRIRPRRVAGPVPNLDSAAMWLPDSVAHLTFLADGDSDPFATRCAMERGETRHAVRGRQVSTAWAPEGMDFNDLRRRRHLPDGETGRAAA